MFFFLVVRIRIRRVRSRAFVWTYRDGPANQDVSSPRAFRCVTALLPFEHLDHRKFYSYYSSETSRTSRTAGAALTRLGLSSHPSDSIAPLFFYSLLLFLYTGQPVAQCLILSLKRPNK